MQAGIVFARSFQGAFDNGALHALALEYGIEILHALFDIGTNDLNIRFQMSIAFGQRTDLFFRAGEVSRIFIALDKALLRSVKAMRACS